MLLQELKKNNLINPPKWLIDNCHYLTITGSISYGTNLQTSDFDICGWCIPKKEIIFPHTIGIIQGFGQQGEKFEQYIQHHIKTDDKEYDLTIFNIIKYFSLLMENNPNIIDTLFVPYECILHISRIGNIVRENRKLFLHKGCFPKYKGYAFAQLHKMNSKDPEEGSNRNKIREQFGFDVKYAMHLVRLLGYVEQILLYEDLDLRKDKEHLKAIRRGEIPQEDILKWATAKEQSLEQLYTKSSLRNKPLEKEIKQILINCLEEHYGTIENCIVNIDNNLVALNKIKNILDELNL